MVKLARETRAMFEQQPSVVGTTGEGRAPHIGPKRSKLSHRIGELIYKINRFYYPPESVATMRCRAFLKIL